MSEFEQNLVGSVLMDSARLTEVDCLPEHFENGFCREVFKAILAMANANKAIDALTVADELEKKTGKDWLTGCAGLAAAAISPKSLKPYSDEIKQNHKRRNAIQIAENLISQSRALDDSAIDQAIIQLMSLGNEARNTCFTMKDALRASYSHLETLLNGGGTDAIPTGFRALDENLGGFHKTDLIIVGARPAMGKTALVQNFILKGGVPCGFFSTEQSAMQMANRFICMAGGVHGWRMRSGDIGESDWPGVNSAIAQLSERDIYIDEHSQPTIADIQRQARRWKQQYNIQAIHVDYVQRIHATDRRAPKHERVEEVVTGLKSLAKELEVPVIALAQVNRSVDSKSDPRPGMGDLKDSGSIEQEADQVMMLYRDEVYNAKTESPGIAEIIIEKNRHGPTNFVRLAWDGSTFRFSDLASVHGFRSAV